MAIIPATLLLAMFVACGSTPDTLASAPANLVIETYITGLVAPWAIDFASDGRVFITERTGRIRVITGGRLQPRPWMTLDVAAVGEAGLLGLALDPHFDGNRYIYVAYTRRTASGRLENRLVRVREDPKTAVGVLDKVLIDNVPGASNHDGGRLKFGSDGKLYWTIGDAQEPPRAQNLSSLNGKILRLNPDGSIPADNPFPGSYVYSYGHRNPQGLAWQPGTARLYATEHGPSGLWNCCQDELNNIEPGKNYGWPEITGEETHVGMITPLLQSGTSETWAPSGATFASRGPWAGSLLFTGLRGQSLYRVQLDPKDPRAVVNFERLLYQRFGRLRDIAEGPNGSLYMLTSNRDGRGNPSADDDRILKLSFK
jgi:glucose/arabinose dehydrogenase